MSIHPLAARSMALSMGFLAIAIALVPARAFQPSTDTPPPQVISVRPAEPGSVIVLNKAEASGMVFRPGADAADTTFEVGDGPHEVAISGTTAVVSNYGGPTPGRTLTVIDLVKLQPVKTITVGEYLRPHGLAFMRDGRHVLVTCEVQQSLLQVNIESGTIVKTWETGQQGSHMVALAADEKTAYITNVGSGSVSIIELAKQGEEAASVVMAAPGSEGLALSPDGNELWIANNKSDSICILDTARKLITASIPCAKYPLRVAFTPDGAHVLAAASASGDIIVYNAKTRAEERRIKTVPKMKAGSEVQADPLALDGPFKGSPIPIGIAITPDSATAFVACTASGTIARIDLKTWRVTGHLKTGKNPDGIGLVPAR